MSENASNATLPNAAPWEQEQMTARQRQMFATCAAKMEAETGKTLAQWVTIAHTCPQTTVKGRMDWLDRQHGIRTMRAHLLMAAAFPEAAPTPDELFQALWKDEHARRIAEAVIALASALPEVIVAQRKGYTSFSRKVQFAAARPIKGGVRLGLGLSSDASARLSARAKSESLQDRLKAVVDLSATDQVDAEVAELLRAAAERA
jgi:hypothetical protein